MSIFIVVCTLAPGLLWLQWLLKRDGYEPEPLKRIALAFGLGMLVTLPAGLINSLALDSQAFQNLFSVMDSSGSTLTVGTPGLVAMCFGIIGPTEELLKFGIVYFFFFRHKEFDEPIDGLIYAGSVALGFATAENFLYVSQYGVEVLLVRGLLTVPAHVLFSASYGYAMGMKKGLASTKAGGYRTANVASTAQSAAEREHIPHPDRGPSLSQGVLFAIAAHGAYDFVVFQGVAVDQMLFTWGGILLILGVLTQRWKTQAATLGSYSQFKKGDPRYTLK
jgi:RsiW-degrading membrane proteinase PrsW (M82 family)